MDPTIRSARVDELFSETNTLSRYIEVEVALARVQANLKLIPERAAQAIEEHATVARIDQARFREDFARVGFPIVGFVRQMTEVVPDGLGQYIHWGATTQDITDSSLVLALRDVSHWVEEEMQLIVDLVAALVLEHRDSLTIGRSQLQQAVPVTFGYKAAGWLASLEEHQQRFDELRPRLLQVQFGGAVGTMAALHPHGPDVRRELSKNLKLEEPTMSWHTRRESLAEFVNFLGLMTGSLAKIATDVMLLAQTEIGEVHEPTASGRGISSTMPQKRNPVLSQQIIVAARLVRAKVSGMLEAMVQDHERGSATWQAEWTLIPDATSHALSALERTQELLSGLTIVPERMRENLRQSRQFVYAEAVMMALALDLGLQKAHDLVESAVDEARDGKSFLDALLRCTEIKDILSESDLRAIFDGEASIAASARVVDDVLAQRRRHSRQGP
ncbi:MAG: class-II fumarase/aspartase family protein [Woeseiaceae bacterium]